MPTKATLLQPETVEALRWYTAQTLEHNVAVKGLGPFIQGKQGMNANESSWAPERFAAADFAWDVVAMPRGPVSNVTAVFMNNVQMVDTPRVEVAWEWVKFLALDPQSVAYLTKISGRTPVLASVFPEYMELVQIPANRALWFEELSNARSIFHSDKFADITRILNPTMNRVIDGQEEIVSALTVAQQQLNALLSE